VPRRVSLPGADELFRTTGGTSLTPAPRAPDSMQNREAVQAREAREAREAGTQLRESREGQPDDPAGEHGAATAESSAPAQQAAGQFGTVARNGATHNGAARNGAQVPAARSAAQPSSAEEPARRKPRGGGRSRPTGRERHEEKITVYVSAEELIDLEHARLVLRGEHGLAVDRGRIVREAVAVVLADLDQRGEASILVRRLRGR
jgi:hypothetical protein